MASLDSLNNPLVTDVLARHSVYRLVDPDGDEVGYVGKGTSWRCAAHLGEDHVAGDEAQEDEPSAKQRRIETIRARGDQPRAESARRHRPRKAPGMLIQ